MPSHFLWIHHPRINSWPVFLNPSGHRHEQIVPRYIVDAAALGTRSSSKRERRSAFRSSTTTIPAYLGTKGGRALTRSRKPPARIAASRKEVNGIRVARMDVLPIKSREIVSLRLFWQGKQALEKKPAMSSRVGASARAEKTTLSRMSHPAYTVPGRDDGQRGCRSPVSRTIRRDQHAILASDYEEPMGGSMTRSA
jgi:hypothetical protein